MTRERRSLDGTWRFWPDLDGRFDALPADDPGPAPGELDRSLGPARAIRVPGMWQAQLDDLREWAGGAWYARDFDVPAGWEAETVLLRFGAVEYACAVAVNGVPVGAHEGGYLPFALDVTAALRPGRANTVAVRVIDPSPATAGPFPFAEVPHGKQSWYGPLGGIWQGVVLEAGAPVRVEAALVDADAPSGIASVRVRLSAGAAGGEGVTVTVVAPGGGLWTARGRPFESGEREQRVDVATGRPALWSPGSPRLHRVAVRLDRDGRAVDELDDEFGFRTVEARDGALLLNGEPVYLRGALDQDYYPRTIAAPESEDLLRETMLRARELGLNLLRCHIKVPVPEYFRLTDRLGLLAWAELPNWQTLTPAAAERAERTLAGLVERDWNRPSIVVRSVVNESWGVDLGRAEERAWTRAAYRRLKELDPDRLAVDNSACIGNFHVESDLNDFHVYFAIPDHADAFERFADGWTRDPGSTWSPHGDAARRGDEPLVLSEFGNWGLPDVDELRDEEGRLPWWFATGAGREDGVVHPAGVQERFREWGLADVFGGWRAFVRESQEHEHDALRFEICDLRRRQAIAGYVVTELTDAHWECNGLLDMERRPKAFHDRLRRCNADDVVVLRPARRRLAPGDELEVELWLSHYSGRGARGGRVEWSVEALGARGELELGPLRRGAVAGPHRIGGAVGEVAAPQRIEIRARAVDRAGRTLAEGVEEVLVLPPAGAPPPGVRVAARLDADLRAHVAAGGRALVVATSADALPADAALAVEARAGGRHEGSWAQGMTWLRPELRTGLALRPRLDLPFAGLVPEHVLVGYTPGEHRDVLAGIYQGWIREVAGLAGAFRLGDGAGVVTTFPLLDHRDDPLAAQLLQRLAELAAAPALRPARRLVPD